MTESEDRSLELDAQEMRAMVERAMERIVRHVETLGEQPASVVEGGKELSRSLVEPLPEAPAPFTDLLDLLFDRLVPHSFTSAGPGYLAYVPGGGLFHSAVADLIADSVNRYVGAWLAAPGLVRLESNVIRWFCDMVGFPPGSGGFLTSGGSIANLTALITARRERLPEDFLRGTLYVSAETHHSVAKAAVLAGFPPRNVRRLATDGDFRLRLGELEERIRDDRRQGLTPFFVVANAGTTNTGAVDDLSGMAEIARREDLWLHVDAAYGGFFLLTERGRAVLRGISAADSITLDPHKGLFLPFGTGSLVVRDLSTLKRAHSVRADYMPAMQEDDDLTDFCEISPELSRDFRGLRVWLPLKLHGAGPFRRNLDEKLDLARWAAGELEKIPEVEIVARPQLSLLAFALAPPSVAGPELDRLNRDLLDRVNRRRRVFLTGTFLDGRFVLRICVLSFRTHRDRMEMALEDVRQAAAEVLAGCSSGSPQFA
jgi:aromatic-L-amino-acid decarboxylase